MFIHIDNQPYIIFPCLLESLTHSFGVLVNDAFEKGRLKSPSFEDKSLQAFQVSLQVFQVTPRFRFLRSGRHGVVPTDTRQENRRPNGREQ